MGKQIEKQRNRENALTKSRVADLQTEIQRDRKTKIQKNKETEKQIYGTVKKD